MKLEKSVTCANVNQNLLNIQYAVRGPLLERAMQIEKELKKGVRKPFVRVIRANIGDCHALGQKPITFIRQVVALASCPQLMSSSHIPEDVKERVREILQDCTQGSVGSYSPPFGLAVVRSRVAQYLELQDGIPTSPDAVYIGSGASDLVKSVLTLFVEDVGGKPPAVMLPTPQYPLFSATLAELGIKQAPYYLAEDRSWSLDAKELRRAWRQASQDCCIRAIVVISPGNPTGQVLSKENIEEVVRFAYEHNLFILADEVYRENIVSKQFYSFRQVMHSMGAPYSSQELASFTTCSKGWAAECGLRCGTLTLEGVGTEVLMAFQASRAVMQCPTVLGQCVLDCVMQPPALEQPSYEKFAKEKENIHRVLTERTETAYRTFNSIPGYSCNPIDGSMFAFPRVDIPVSAQRAARDAALLPDEFYCLQLLEATGICVVPGSGFGQRPNTFHFRTTILHPAQEFLHMMTAIDSFHRDFLRQYTDADSDGC